MIVLFVFFVIPNVTDAIQRHSDSVRLVSSDEVFAKVWGSRAMRFRMIIEMMSAVSSFDDPFFMLVII
jgi:hypothetical protein